MVDNSCIIEGNVKFRDGKKWKSRWCVMRKLSPVADCLHLQLYGDCKDRYKQGQTKASLSLQHFLGVQSGFTLDKESNTIAIICQDVTVVLAFDTRERLIQWQVKISNNLGEDQKLLILISSAPSKAKLPTGPAYLHIQDYRFCIAVGIPPRLVGVWEIAHLRRYGVIEGRFCFEGGSRCGRGEGLHVLKTDQAEEIVRTLHLAAEGKLATRKRTGRSTAADLNSIAPDSPRRQFSRSDTRVSDCFHSTLFNGSYEDHSDEYKQEDLVIWSSTESRQETVLTELDNDYGRDSVSVSEEQQHDWQHMCSSYTRQQAPMLDRCASCISKLGTISKSSTAATATNNSAFGNSSPEPAMSASVHMPSRAFDRLSLSSYSSSSHDSDYSVSQQVDCHGCAQLKSSRRSSQSPLALPPRPPKPSNSKQSIKSPMPLPNAAACGCMQNSRNSATCFENYDVPKTIYPQRLATDQAAHVAALAAANNYDTPRKIKQCLAMQNPKSNYPNYDTPQAMQQCGCPSKHGLSRTPSACPCHNVMSWAGFVLPYCRRGAGIEPTTVTVQPVKLSGEGKMPVVDASADIIVFHDDSTLKRKTKCAANNNYENVEVHQPPKPKCKQDSNNYANIEFEQSLNLYENSKDMKTQPQVEEQHQQVESETEQQPVCQKCGHVKDSETPYTTLENEEDSPKKQNHALPHVFTRLSSAKSSSNPTLSRSSPLEGTRKRSDSEYRIPGSAMLSSPYFRRRLLSDSLETSALLRKRSYSAESTHCFDKESSQSFASSNPAIHSETKITPVEEPQSCPVKREPVQSIKIRRSSSVPSKSGHNRDSSSSNDSGVSIIADIDFGTDCFENKQKPLSRVNGYSTPLKNNLPGCYHSSLPRKSKCTDPLREISFQFRKTDVMPPKSSSAEPDILPKEGKTFNSPEAPAVPYVDSRSTSSGTSDMSDYIETLSLSSHSSSDTPDNLRLGGRGVTTTLRPRSGKEYYKIDRSILMEQATRTIGSNYANITPLLEKSESPSPGYMSSSPQPASSQHFFFPEVRKSIEETS